LLPLLDELGGLADNQRTNANIQGLTLEQALLIPICKTFAKAPIHLYRATLRPFVGWECRHLPSCSDYGLEAIDVNGAWRGTWLTLARVLRCHPLGSSGLDPVPDVRFERHPFAPWRYGRWSKRSIG
jgi:putative membrane protein insertion efficiency factor